MDYKNIQRSEVKVDIYSDENTKHFETYCDGDMDSDTHSDDIIIKLADLPPGATIFINYPCCPQCSLPREDEYESLKGGVLKIIGHKEKCDCGFDWGNWVECEYA